MATNLNTEQRNKINNIINILGLTEEKKPLVTTTLNNNQWNIENSINILLDKNIINNDNPIILDPLPESQDQKVDHIMNLLGFIEERRGDVINVLNKEEGNIQDTIIHFLDNNDITLIENISTNIDPKNPTHDVHVLESKSSIPSKNNKIEKKTFLQSSTPISSILTEEPIPSPPQTTLTPNSQPTFTHIYHTNKKNICTFTLHIATDEPFLLKLNDHYTPNFNLSWIDEYLYNPTHRTLVYSSHGIFFNNSISSMDTNLISIIIKQCNESHEPLWGVEHRRNLITLNDRRIYDILKINPKLLTHKEYKYHFDMELNLFKIPNRIPSIHSCFNSPDNCRLVFTMYHEVFNKTWKYILSTTPPERNLSLVQITDKIKERKVYPIEKNMNINITQIRLYAHQKFSLKFMLAHERTPLYYSNLIISEIIINPLDPNKNIKYSNLFNMIIKEERIPRGGLLCDETGMGKTITTIALIQENPPNWAEPDALSFLPKDLKVQKGKKGMNVPIPAGNTLIIVPSSTIDQMAKAFEYWAPE